ncbi:MAG: hypothetical protein AAB665_03995 [Patescibacteria group bacterium]
MRGQKPKLTKRELRQTLRLTRPPRLEGKAKNAMTDPVRKKKAARVKARTPGKMQGYTERQRKDYHLKNERRG